MSELLPKLVRDLEQLVGLPAALRLVQRFGGVRVYIPATMPDDHHLAQLLGHEAASSISQRYAGEYPRIPRCARLLRAERDRRIRESWRTGKSPRDLALEFRLTDRQVWRIIAGTKRTDDSQLDLF